MDELHIDALDGNWIKGPGGWDITLNNRIVDNLRDLYEWLACSRMTVEQFKASHLYRSHVQHPGFEWLGDL